MNADTVDPQAFRQAMSRFATGVTVLTTKVGSLDQAMTANSVASVSLEPPMLLACVHAQSRFAEYVQASGVWAVSVLPASMRAVADWLAVPGRPAHGHLERIAHHRTASHLAVLDGANAQFSCRTYAQYPGGDHVILVGVVEQVLLPPAVDPALVYYRGEYQQLP